MRELDQFELLVCLEATSANLDSSSSRERRPLEIWIFPVHSRRIEFCRTNSITVTAGHDGAFGADWACLGHRSTVFFYGCRMLS